MRRIQVIQPQPSTQLPSKDSILFIEIIDGVLLLLIHAAGHGDQHEPAWVQSRCRCVWRWHAARSECPTPSSGEPGQSVSSRTAASGPPTGYLTLPSLPKVQRSAPSRSSVTRSPLISTNPELTICWPVQSNCS